MKKIILFFVCVVIIVLVVFMNWFMTNKNSLQEVKNFNNNFLSYIENENGQKFLCKEYYRFGNNIINFSIPVEEKFDKFKIILKVNDKEIIFT